MFAFLSQIKVLKVKYPQCIDAAVLVAGRQLLKNIHVSKLQPVVGIGMVMKAYKKPVLIKRIVDYFFAKIDHGFIAYRKTKRTLLESVFAQRKLQ